MDADDQMSGMEPAMESPQRAMDPEAGMDGLSPGDGGSPGGMGEGDGGSPAKVDMDGMDGQDYQEEGLAGQASGEATGKEEVLDFASDARLQKMVAHVAEALIETPFAVEEHWRDDHYVRLHDFLSEAEPKVIFLWLEAEEMALRVSEHGPPSFYEHTQLVQSPQDYQVAYFLKKGSTEGWTPVTAADNLEERVLFGHLATDPLEDLRDKMEGEHVKKLLQENEWPDGVKKEFIANLHRFMAFLHETTHAARGQTWLYIPDEDLTDIEAAAKDKDLLQRLESTVIYWTRQIKELVSNQDSPTTQAVESPLDEIDYWTKRSKNLTVLTLRLQNAELKKIIKVLEQASSSYLPGFRALEKRIQEGSAEAQNNLQFLDLLAEPCRKIENARPKDIPGILPEVLNNVRVIWELSEHYNTPERMKGLLTKISNQIIRRCRARINKDDMLDGDVEKCMDDLDESITCCKEWKSICLNQQRLLKKYSSRPGWALDEDETIFAENEAFIQRCKDLREICEGQLQFARKGAKQVMPVFGGTKGPEYTENLKELERSFTKNLQNIKNLDYDILDVKITKWHDNYGQLFKEQCKSLEIMYQNIIALAFKNVSTVSDAVEMLENFDSLAKRPPVREYVHRKAAEMVYKLFKDEIKEVEETFEGHDKAGKGPPPMPFSHPHWAGLAIWARSLMQRIQKAKSAIEGLYFIPEHSHAKDALEAYDKLRRALDKFIADTCFRSWEAEINAMDGDTQGKGIDEKLDVTVLVRAEHNTRELPSSLSGNALFARDRKNGLLESNFDCDLHKVMVEVAYWTKLGTQGFVPVPHTVSRLLGRREHFRILRENVMLIVREYNTIIHTVSEKERHLFKEHLELLDRTIEPGIRRHKWHAPADTFVYACRKECQEVFHSVKRFQSNVQSIYAEFEAIATTTLTSIQKKLYLLSEFTGQQEAALKAREREWEEAFERIAAKVMETYELFIHRGAKIQGEWLAFVRRLDETLEKSLKQSVKNTLLDLGKHIVGDKQRQELVPIFRVYTVLDAAQAQGSWKPVHEPTHQQLKDSIDTFMKQIVRVTRVVPRVERIFRERRAAQIAAIKKELDDSQQSGGNPAAALAKAGMRQDNYQNLSEEEKEAHWQERWKLPNPEDKPEYEERIARNRKIKNKTEEILRGIEEVEGAMAADAKHWQASEEVRQLRAVRTQGHRKRALRGAQGEHDLDPVQRYKEQIDSLWDVMNDVKNKQPQKPEQFIILDCSRLKSSLTESGNQLLLDIIDQLMGEARDELNNLLAEFATTIDTLKTPPAKLEQLKENKDLYAAVKAKLPALSARREPIKKKFHYLADFEGGESGLTELSDDDKAKLESLDSEWERFNQGLDEANVIIQKCYAQLKTEVDSGIEDFKRECQENRKNFAAQAPYASLAADKGSDNAKAFEKLQEFKGHTAELRAQEEAMKFGLEIFDIEPMAYPEMSLVEKEIAQLTEIWEAKDAWDKQWEVWKDVRFADLDQNGRTRDGQDLDEVAIDFQDQCRAFDRDVREWGVYLALRQGIDTVRATLPLILDLRDEAMRERHWRELRSEVKEDFDETSDEFTLEKVFSLGLLQHQEKIAALAENARRQLKIELALKEIKHAWEEDPSTDLDVDKQKSKADQEEYYYIRSTDNVMALIEDHGVKLSGMKSSPYYKEFDSKIDEWEGNIAAITETLEALLAVQSKWRYLESIFRGQADISKQLPSEESIFKRNHEIFKKEMARINSERNCLRALTGPKTFLSTLLELNKKFEQIQKNLNQFLEAKRGQFPRFYFLSNEDLLEIIGQSKDPKPILQHISKMFEGVATLQIGPPDAPGGGRGSKNYEITALESAEGEQVELQPKPITVEPKVESWLKKLVDGMREALRRAFWKYQAENAQGARKPFERDKLSKVIKAVGIPGQVLITSAQMAWTAEVGAALASMDGPAAASAGGSLKKCRANYKKRVDNYIELVEKPAIAKLERLKLVALIIVDEHNREIIERLYQQKITSPRHFEWLQQLRFVRAPTAEEGDQLHIAVEQTNCSFDYGYEYQGNNGRLVVTELTDRAYMTLTNALNMQRGGAPQGPAGTGKTETVKDLGKNLAFFVVIQNCSDQMDYASLAKIFAGLALSGAWGCFDEFNRIQVDVLSVVAQQVQTILDAIRRKEASTPFGELNIQVQKDTGLFITMNPGYAGRSELPDNLACLFRPVAMMAPDFTAIAKITLMSEGFKQNELLAKKIVTIYALMQRQLSKQDHYDFGMRAVKSVLNASGRIKRERPEISDEVMVVIKAIRDMNLPKFIAEDVLLFDNLFIDLFPDCDEPDNDNDDLQIAIEEALMRKNLELNENLVVKIMQLYESKVTRHGNMLVGETLSGKTKCWEILADALNALNQEEKERGVKGEDFRYLAVKPELINPKAVTVDELYGYSDDQNPPQWHDGILSTVLKRICSTDNSKDKEIQLRSAWMVLDGPVDTLWIESLNSVLDDSKLLTLTNGDRIALSANVRLLFEVENLAVASPATVSRAGMIYLDLEELGWEPYMKMWIKQKEGEGVRELLDELVHKYLPKVLKVKRTRCTELVKTSESAGVFNLCRLFDAVAKPYLRPPDDAEEAEAHRVFLEKWFVFCLVWSVGATVEEESRKHIDGILRDIESLFPHANTVYEHHVSADKRDWAAWEEKLAGHGHKPSAKDFHKINVPTVDTVRNRSIVQALLEHGSQVLLVGHSGVGKTVLVDGVLRTLDAKWHEFTMNFSAGTTSLATQEIIESNFERRAKNKYRPKNAKQKAVCFIDDLNMPRKDTHGSQPPLELVRQWLDYEFWFDRQKIQPNYIQDLQFLSAMGQPGGGRAEISARLLSKFHVVNYTVPTESNMQRIFATIATLKFTQFDEEIKTLADPLAAATISLFHTVQAQFLPTPARSHYVFNMRDVSKVFQGLYKADRNYYEGKEHILKLWAHEVLRVFQDRLISQEDRDRFKGYLNEQLESVFSANYAEHCTTAGDDAIYVDFLGDRQAEPVYEEVVDFPGLRTFLNEALELYNNQPKLIKMNLVLFKDAITHVARIYRVLSLKRGHAFLVGVGGSGRHSLTRLAAFISEPSMNVYQLEVTKGFALKQFREFLKGMYEVAGYKGRNTLRTVFLFSDNDVVQESFLEDIQNMLNSGLVPGLYTQDELGKLREDGLRKVFKRIQKQKAQPAAESPELINEFFFTNIKDNLHLSICMSPIGETFRNYCRMFPALINNTTIDWFMGWPDDALREVAERFIGQMELGQELEPGLARLCAVAHSSTTAMAEQMKRELKRVFYVTPTNYVELLKGYGEILRAKRTEVDAQRTKLRNGLSKLDDARAQVEAMSAEAEVTRAEVSRQQKLCEELMQALGRERKKADEQQGEIEQERAKITKEEEETRQLAADAEAELKKAEPALLAAQEALEGLDKKHISEIKSFPQPPEAVATVMSAVMIVLGRDPSWLTVKKELAEPTFVKRITAFDKDAIPQATLRRIEKYTRLETFLPEKVTQVSLAAGALCLWVRSLEDYARALKIVAPKRAKKEYAEEQLRKKQASLAELEAAFKALAAKLQELEATFRTTTSAQAAYRAELDSLQVKIDRGDRLVSGLAGEKTRWEATLVELDARYEKLVGDCVLAAAFMSYCGPFPSEYRDSLVASWITTVEAEKIPFDEAFEFHQFMAGEAVARRWQLNGLPTDKFSTENGVFVTQGLRWALNIDPQSQAMNWIKRTGEENGAKPGGRCLRVADSKDPKSTEIVREAVRHGQEVLLQDVGQELDPVLDNVLNKSLILVGRTLCVRFGDKEVEYDKNFKLYITTRMGNPHYTPEVSTKVAVVNFTVKESGLEEQCLGIVVQEEQPSLENTKNDVIQKIAANKATILELEDTILRMLSDSKVNLLEDVALTDTLQSSKDTSDSVKQALVTSTQTMRKINDTREQYRQCGRVASILFFVLNDLVKIDPMYQFSLDWYKALFKKSIEESKEHMLQDRYKSITRYHTLQVYRQACRSLFERHKLLLAMQMCIKLQMAEGRIDEAEWNFFLKGGQVLDRSGQPPKPPFDWISQPAWDNVCELEKALPETYTGITNAVTLSPRDWQRWYLSVPPAPPEAAQLPGEWETKCEDRLKKMIVLRCFRTDRVLFAIRAYVERELGKEYTENRPTLLKEVMNESVREDPVIVVLCPGVDPQAALRRQAEELRVAFEPISMGRGASDRAAKLKNTIGDAADPEKDWGTAPPGSWIFLANCHLCVNLLPELEAIVEGLFKGDKPVAENFRLILSAMPHPEFSISLLQRSLKVAQEPPRGIKSNLLRLYAQKDQFQSVHDERAFRKAFFGLCWFHTILIERKKFKSLGWCVNYAFNDSDFAVCEDLLALYMGLHGPEGKPVDPNYLENKKSGLPWAAIQYLVAAASYGGRVTDDRDRRLLAVYAKEIFNERLIAPERWRPWGTEELSYVYPADELGAKHNDFRAVFTPTFFYDEIVSKMDEDDPPQAYGQHINAEITSQILDSEELLESVLTLTPQKSASGEAGGTTEAELALVRDLQSRLPAKVSVRELKAKLKGDENPLNVVLQQEIQRYNILLDVLAAGLAQLESGIQGLTVISPELELVQAALREGKVPTAWSFAYFSLKPLSSWCGDLVARYAFFTSWSQKGMPFHFWIGAFTYPTGFTTALQQRFSRKASGAPIDRLEFDFIPVGKEPREINEHPKDGAFISGLLLEGAKWNPERLCLCEPEVMELLCPMPVVHFKPIQRRAKPPQNVYECPCYYYPKRSGTIGRDSWMLRVDLRSGEAPAEYWIKRGTALLMSDAL